MKTSNPFLDTLVESQSQFVNNWMESAKKMQNAFTSGNITSEGQSLYKEFFDKQMSLFNNLQQSAPGAFGGQNNPQDFFRNWFNQQAQYAKQMADFGQSIQSSFANFGKPAQDYMAGFGQSNTAFSNIYNSWMNTLNASYDTMSRNMNGSFNKDVFSNFMQGNQVYAKMQEFFQLILNGLQKGQFNMEAFKNQVSPEAYANLAKQIFGGMYNEAAIKDVYDNSIKQLHGFFATQNNLGKEFFSQMQNLSKVMPDMMGNGTVATSLKEFYAQINNVFGKTFEPLLKLVNAGKEKENAEALIALMDRMAEYSVKQAELQTYLQETAKKGIEKIAQQYADKYSDPQAMSQLPSIQDMYSEWVKVNEQLFTELFASEEFSKVKGEALNLSMDVKKHFEKQFEQSFANLPLVFKSEVEDLEKTIHDLKKQVRDLQNKLAAQGGAAESDEEKVKKHKK